MAILIYDDIQQNPKNIYIVHTPAMLYRSVRTITSGVRVPNKAWPAHLIENEINELTKTKFHNNDNNLNQIF
jgi:hypothetical protein